MRLSETAKSWRPATRSPIRKRAVFEELTEAGGAFAIAGGVDEVENARGGVDLVDGRQEVLFFEI